MRLFVYYLCSLVGQRNSPRAGVMSRVSRTQTWSIVRCSINHCWLALLTLVVIRTHTHIYLGHVGVWGPNVEKGEDWVEAEGGVQQQDILIAYVFILKAAHIEGVRWQSRDRRFQSWAIRHSVSDIPYVTFAEEKTEQKSQCHRATSACLGLVQKDGNWKSLNPGHCPV